MYAEPKAVESPRHFHARPSQNGASGGIVGAVIESTQPYSKTSRFSNKASDGPSHHAVQLYYHTRRVPCPGESCIVSHGWSGSLLKMP